MKEKEIGDLKTQEYNDLVYSEISTGKYQPLGLFVYQYSHNEFFALDNSTGQLHTDTFFTREAAVEWLTIPVEEMGHDRKLSHVVWNRAIESVSENKAE